MLVFKIRGSNCSSRAFGAKLLRSWVYFTTGARLFLLFLYLSGVFLIRNFEEVLHY